MFTAKYNGANGTQIWVNKYDSDPIDGYRRDDIAFDFDIDRNNNIYVVGTSYLVDESYRLKILQYNDDGFLNSDRTYKFGNKSYGHIIKMINNGEKIVLIGLGYRYDDPDAYKLIKIDVDEKVVWEKWINISNPIEMLLDSNKSIYVLSEEKLTKFNENGNYEWDKSNYFKKMMFSESEDLILISETNLIQYSSTGEKKFDKKIEFIHETTLYDFSLGENISILGSAKTNEGTEIQLLYVFDLQGNFISDYSKKIKDFICITDGNVVLRTVETDLLGNIVIGGYHSL